MPHLPASTRSRLSLAVRHALFAGLLTGGPLLLAMPVSQAVASEQSRSYAIPAGPLDQALNRFASEAGILLSVDAQLTAGKRSPGLNGRYSVAEGFSLLLAGTGLRALNQGGNYALAVAPQDGDALELGATTVTGARLGATTEGTGSYTSGAITIGKGEHSLKETPQSVTVITRKRMDDQNLNTIEQVMEQTPGVAVSGSPMGGKYFYSRGFKMDAPFQYDGVPLDVGGNYVQANSFSSDMAFYDHVEFLRGAAGMMQGAGTPAGAVNLVRKRGQDKPTTTVTLSGGTWDNYRAQVDVGGPLNEAGSLRGRAVVGEQKRHFFYDNGKRDDQLAYGSLDYDFTDDTTAGIGIAYEKLQATPCFGGLPSYSDGSNIKAKRSTCLGASWNHWDSERTTVFGDVRHRLNDDWNLRLAGAYTHNEQDMKYVQGAGAGGTISPGSTSASTTAIYGLFDYDSVDYGFDGYLDGKFHAWGLEHQLTVGANTSYSHSHDLWALAYATQTSNVFNPTHFTEPSDSYIINNAYRGGWPYPTVTTVKQHGIYSNLRLKLAEPLILVQGARLSDWDYFNDSKAYGSVSRTEKQETGEVTPFAGLLYDLTDNLTVYTSYADIFQPQTYVDADGKMLGPKTGKNYELGVKGEWFDGALNGSFNLFRTYQEHGAAALDSSQCKASSSCSADTGKVRAQGVEMELTGSPIERLQATAGYTYTQTKTIQAVRNVNVAVSDQDTYNTLIPRHSLRLWSDYQFAGALDRWSIGGGVNAQSDISRLSSSIKTEQAGYAIWNGRIAYRLDDHWTVALNGNNLFDKVYYATIGDRTGANYYGEPRNYMVTVQGKF